MALREEAEERVRSINFEKDARRRSLENHRLGLSTRNNSNKFPTDRMSPCRINKVITANPDENETPKAAALAAIDYKWNGSRARANSDDVVLPRYVADEEVVKCQSCNFEFDWISRRHHCRYCRKIFCEDCSAFQLLLPIEYGLKDPQRVCGMCYKTLLPQQAYLTNSVANHQRHNMIDLASPNCNVRRYFNMPYSSTLGSEIRKAAYSMHNLYSLDWVKDRGIPLTMLRETKGIAFLTIVKGGFIFAPRFGTGLVISKMADGRWSAPSAIGTWGLSWGAIAGLDFTDSVIFLTSDDAVAAFSGRGQVTIGAGIEVALGPVGRAGSADVHLGDTGIAPAYSYSHSRGLLAGVSLDGSVIFARGDVNYRFYGREYTPLQLLSGSINPPRAAEPLYEALREAFMAMPNPRYLHQRMAHPLRFGTEPGASMGHIGCVQQQRGVISYTDDSKRDIVI